MDIAPFPLAADEAIFRIAFVDDAGNSRLTDD